MTSPVDGPASCERCRGSHTVAPVSSRERMYSVVRPLPTRAPPAACIEAATPVSVAPPIFAPASAVSTSPASPNRHVGSGRALPAEEVGGCRRVRELPRRALHDREVGLALDAQLEPERARLDSQAHARAAGAALRAGHDHRAVGLRRHRPAVLAADPHPRHRDRRPTAARAAAHRAWLEPGRLRVRAPADVAPDDADPGLDLARDRRADVVEPDEHPGAEQRGGDQGEEADVFGGPLPGLGAHGVSGAGESRPGRANSAFRAAGSATRDAGAISSHGAKARTRARNLGPYPAAVRLGRPS